MESARGGLGKALISLKFTKPADIWHKDYWGVGDLGRHPAFAGNGGVRKW